ncbi:MAG: sporulation protein YqfD [Clostridia bacterium]|nr:sporulation protein YqfD [Clostridia bacterium]
MYLQKIQTTITGYVSIEVEGYYIEKFINICRNNGIYLECLKREKTTIIHANIPVKEFKRVAKIAKSNKCKVKIKEKKGLPFFLNKYRKRKIFVISLVIMLLSLVALSKFIWNIEITGNVNISNDEILEIVKSEGLEIGKLKNKVDAKKIVEKIRLQRSDVSWVGIKISGTNAVIEIVEADKAPEVIDKDEYCNIVAKKDAMIINANAQNGTLQVKEGDVVKAGSVLIAGWLEGKYTGTRYVHATGEVTAKVWYSEKEKIYYKQKVKNKTGNSEKKYSININNFAINFYKRLSKFEIYDTISAEKKLKVSSNFYLPFELIVKENYELIEEEKIYTKEEAKEIGVNKLSEKLNSQIENTEDIVNKYINTNESEEYIEVEVIYEVLENIGTEEKIAL